MLKMVPRWFQDSPDFITENIAFLDQRSKDSKTSFSDEVVSPPPTDTLVRNVFKGLSNLNNIESLSVFPSLSLHLSWPFFVSHSMIKNRSFDSRITILKR